MSLWKIAGQTGKNLAAAQVDLEVAQCLNARLDFASQEADRFSFFLLADDPVTDPSYLPDYEQEISVYRAGVRQFVGKVHNPEYLWQGGQAGWNVQAVGGWSELERIPLTTGNASYERAQGNLTTTITDIINKAIAGGAQITLGSIATSFDMIPLTYRGLSCAAALSECLRLLPDAVVYFDYTLAGLPRINITRRPTMTTRTYALGTDEVELCNISPQAGQTPDKVAITYATHDTNGIVAETTQTAGTGTLSNQIMVLADPGFAEFTTNAIAQQIGMFTSTSANWDFAKMTDPKLKDIAGIPTPTTGNMTYITGSTSSTKSTFTEAGKTPAFSGLTAPHSFPLVQGEVKDYMIEKLGITQGTCNFSGDFWWSWRKTINGAAQSKPEWLLALISAGAIVEASAWFNSVNTTGAYYGPHPDYDTVLIIRYAANFSAVAINRSFPALTNVRDPGDYLSTPPPATLAANLLSVQNFVPYKGRVTFTPWSAYERDLGKKCNFPGGSPRIASVGALPQKESITLADGKRELTMGLPPRTALASLMSRFRKTSSK